MQQTIVAAPSDQSFLLELYSSTREAEVAGWDWDPVTLQAFLQMQWRAQSQAYASQYPGADHRIILVDGQRAGRLLVQRTDEGIRLVDIALLPAFRGRGIGAALIRELQAEAKPILLHVLRESPARRLYERLGFRSARSGNAVYDQMVWRPDL